MSVSRYQLFKERVVGFFRKHFRRLSWSPVTSVTALGCLIFVICVATKIHFSSVGIWNSYLQRDQAVPGLLYGSPKAIRSDEWMLGAPWLLSQAHTNPAWSPDNPSVGPDTSALLVGLPTSHWSAIFRPSHWGFYLLDTERGFSWLWMWRSVVLCVALMVLVLELTGGSYACALAATAWIFFSGFVQWWLSSVGEMLTYWTLACISLRALFRSQSSAGVLTAAVVMLVAGAGFGLALYPPFQVPLAYLGLALVPLLLKDCANRGGPRLSTRLLLLAAVTVVGAASLVLFIKDNSVAVATMGNTVYPGRRVSLGGDLSLWRYISGLFESNYSEMVFPAISGNISEASSFIFLWPITLVLVPFFRNQREALRCAPLIVYLVLMILWGVYGVPQSLAVVTGWSFVPTSRALLGWGVGGALLCVVAICQPNRLPRSVGLVFVVLIAAGVFYLLSEFTLRFPSAIPQSQSLVAASLISLAVAGVVFRSAWILCLAMFFLCVVPHSQVNPVMRGLRVINDVPLVRAVKRFDPQREGRWAVFGSPVIAQLVKVTGRDVVNGSQYIPNWDALRQLDPQQQYHEVYNRYALVAFTLAEPGSPLSFRLLAPDTWELSVDPCDDKFKQLGARYIVWANYSSQRRFDCYERVFVGTDFAIYKSKL
jgi:hypothetical protein